MPTQLLADVHQLQDLLRGGNVVYSIRGSSSRRLGSRSRSLGSDRSKPRGGPGGDEVIEDVAGPKPVKDVEALDGLALGILSNRRTS